MQDVQYQNISGVRSLTTVVRNLSSRGTTSAVAEEEEAMAKATSWCGTTTVTAVERESRAHANGRPRKSAACFEDGSVQTHTHGFADLSVTDPSSLSAEMQVTDLKSVHVAHKNLRFSKVHRKINSVRTLSLGRDQANPFLLFFSNRSPFRR